MADSTFHPALRLRVPVPWLLALSAAALTAHAEPTARSGKPDPLDARASVPAVAYQSPLKTHKPPAGDRPVTWKEANDNVARIGGWRVYAREAQPNGPAPALQPAADQPSTTPPAAPQGHSGHKLP